MSFQPEYQKIPSVKYHKIPEYSEILSFKVTDNLDKGVGNIISKSTNMCLTSYDVKDGSIDFTCQINCTISFFDLEGQCRTISYRGDMNGTVPCPTAKEGMEAKLQVKILDDSVDKIVGSTLTISLAYEISGGLFIEDETEVLVDGEDGYVEGEDEDVTENVIMATAPCVVEDESEISKEVSLILSSSGDAIVTSVTMGKDMAVVDGKIIVIVTYQQAGETGDIASHQMEVPYREEVEVIGSNIGFSGTCNVCVNNVDVTAYSKENKNLTTLKCQVMCNLQVTCYEKKEIEYITDVFCCDNELLVTRENLESFHYDGSFTERANKTLSHTFEEEFERVVAVISATCDTVSSSYANGIISIDAIMKNSILMFGDMGYKLKNIECPVHFEVTSTDNDYMNYNVKITPFDTYASLKMANEVEIKSGFNLQLESFHPITLAVITFVDVGEAKANDLNPIVIYISVGGETLLDVAKATETMPQEILNQLQNLTFPLAKGEKIVLYRQKK